MKVGDLVKYKDQRGIRFGIIVDFDVDKDPIIWENGTDIVAANWRDKVEVISESR